MSSTRIRRIAQAATLAVTASAVLIPATAAHAAKSPGCVTRHEYRSVHKHMTMQQVARRFGTNGHKVGKAVSGGYGSMIRNYKTCSRYSAVSISFSKSPGTLWRLDGKAAVWVS